MSYKQTDFLRPVDLKIVRVREQILDFTKKIEEYSSNKPIKLKCELLDGRLGYRLIIEQFAETQSLENLGILAGECIHNLRSSLDNLAFAIARLNCDPPANPKDISFPIFETKLDYNKSPQVKKTLCQLPKKAANLIERIQPFQRAEFNEKITPRDDLLILLQNLNNMDKHRIPILALLAPQKFDFSNNIQFYSEDDAIEEEKSSPQIAYWTEPLKENIVLMEHKTNKPIKSINGETELKVVVAFQVNNYYESADLILKQLNEYVLLITNEFRCFFKSNNIAK